MGFLDDDIIGDDPSDFHHSRRPSLRYLLKSHETVVKEELRKLDENFEREGNESDE